MYSVRISDEEELQCKAVYGYTSNGRARFSDSVHDLYKKHMPPVRSARALLEDRLEKRKALNAEIEHLKKEVEKERALEEEREADADALVNRFRAWCAQQQRVNRARPSSYMIDRFMNDIADDMVACGLTREELIDRANGGD